MDLTRTSPPRILLVEDDLISREVLTLALRDLPADVHAVDSLAAARHALAGVTFDAWLVDAHLPDGDGRDLLALRPASTVALAHTASTDAGVLAGLGASDFVEVLVKPIAAADVQSVVRRVLDAASTRGVDPARVPAGGEQQPVWDDAMALRALAGNEAHVRALRGLFVAELESELDGLAQARLAGDANAIRARLHRLRASCGFVGATRVGAQLQLLDASPFDAVAFDAIGHAGRETLATPDPLGA